MKKNFAEPEMEVVRFNAELAIATSGPTGSTGDISGGETHGGAGNPPFPIIP